MITIYTDGASVGNPGPGGWGAIIVDENTVKEIGGGEAHTTNNKMELTAVIEALKSLEGKEAAIYTDSEYVLKGITEWIERWQKKGWKTAGRKPVLNQDLWQKLLEVARGKKLDWKLVRGHSGIHLNERCDEIATSFAEGLSPHLYNGPRDKYK
ncbi:MAG: ribonuclease HI [bacterium]|nr:ribonuclease HI [bacterium]